MPTTDQQPAPKYKATEGRLIEDGAVIAHSLPPVAMALAARINSHAALVSALDWLVEILRIKTAFTEPLIELLSPRLEKAKSALALAKSKEAM